MSGVQKKVANEDTKQKALVGMKNHGGVKEVRRWLYSKSTHIIWIFWTYFKTTKSADEMMPQGWGDRGKFRLHVLVAGITAAEENSVAQ